MVISEPSEITANLISNDISCYGNCDGFIGAIVSGGASPYTYLWNNDSTLTNDTIINLCEGNYFVNITDNNGCTEEKTYVIEEPQQLSSTSAIPTTNGFAISCNGANDGAINLTPSGGTGVYTYSWTDDNGFTASTDDISNLSAGTYTLVVLDENSSFRCKYFSL